MFGVDDMKGWTNEGKLFRTKAPFFECGPELSDLLAEHRKLVDKRLQESATLSEFFKELREIIHRLLSVGPQDPECGPRQLPDPVFYDQIVRELRELGCDRLTAVDKSLSRITIRLTDSAHRHHSLRVVIPPDYPRARARCWMD
eukprot:195515_1